eukprot:10399220-Alexandrium_andersonii.AAC.1
MCSGMTLASLAFGASSYMIQMPSVTWGRRAATILSTSENVLGRMPPSWSSAKTVAGWGDVAVWLMVMRR